MWRQRQIEKAEMEVWILRGGVCLLVDKDYTLVMNNKKVDLCVYALFSRLETFHHEIALVVARPDYRLLVQQHGVLLRAPIPGTIS